MLLFEQGAVNSDDVSRETHSKISHAEKLKKFSPNLKMFHVKH